jgi:heme exporter protein D
LRITKNTLQLTPRGMRFQWTTRPKYFQTIDFTAMEALELAHQILLHKEVLLEMVRQEQKREQKASASADENTTSSYPQQDIPTRETI